MSIEVPLLEVEISGGGHRTRLRDQLVCLWGAPTVASEPDLCIDVICTSRTQRRCGRGYIHIACRH